MVVVISTIEQRIALCLAQLERMRKHSLPVLLHCDGFKPPKSLKKLVQDVSWSKKLDGPTRKFRWACNFDDNEILFVIDDDILYPDNYFSQGLEDLEKYGDLISYHGKGIKIDGRLTSPDAHFAYKVDKATPTTIPGTGCTFTRAEILKNAYLRGDRKKFKFRSDMLLAVACWEHGWSITRPPSPEEWLKPIDTGSSPALASNREREWKKNLKYARSLGWPT